MTFKFQSINLLIHRHRSPCREWPWESWANFKSGIICLCLFDSVILVFIR